MKKNVHKILFVLLFGLVGLCGTLLFLYVKGKALQTEVNSVGSSELKGLKEELQSLNNQRADQILKITSLGGEIGALEKDKKFPLKNPLILSDKKAVSESIKVLNTQMDSGDNLLVADPYYENTLPHLLPPRFTPRGSLKFGAAGKPDDLNPFTNWSDAGELLSLCSVSLATPHYGKIGATYAPFGATRITKNYNPTTQTMDFKVTLRKDLQWEPLQPIFFDSNWSLPQQFMERHPLTANDYEFLIKVIRNPHFDAAAGYKSAFEEMEDLIVDPNDPYSFTIRWKTKNQKAPYLAFKRTMELSPLAGWLWKYRADGQPFIDDHNSNQVYETDSIWPANMKDHWAKRVITSAGPFVFNGWNEEGIRLLRNNSYNGPNGALINGWEVRLRGSSASIWSDFKAGKSSHFILTPDNFPDYQAFIESEEYKKQVEAHQQINRLEVPSGGFLFIAWNGANPLFKEASIRKALTMAIDRDEIIRTVRHGLAKQITVPLMTSSSAYDQSIQPLPYDPDGAKGILEDHLWFDSNSDGIRDKEGIPFQFTLRFPAESPTHQAIADRIRTYLKRVGIDCILQATGRNETNQAMESRHFDALMMGLTFGGWPEDLQGLWHSKSADMPDSVNIVNFKNKEVDAICDQLDYEDDEAERTRLYHRFHRIIFEQQPHTYLYVPLQIRLTRENIRNFVSPKQSDPNLYESETPDYGVVWIEEGI